MKGLVIDTTIKQGYVAVFDGEREKVVVFDPTLSTQSALIPACREALESMGVTASDLDGIAAVVGPGSFTGIRIGVSFSNAFAFALSLPRFALTSFDVMRPLRPQTSVFTVDAGHDSYYTARLENGVFLQENLEKKDVSTGAVDQSELLAELPKGALIAARKAFEERAFSACAPTAETSLFKPNYMRKSQAERLKEQK